MYPWMCLLIISWACLKQKLCFRKNYQEIWLQGPEHLPVLFPQLHFFIPNLHSLPPAPSQVLANWNPEHGLSYIILTCSHAPFIPSTECVFHGLENEEERLDLRLQSCIELDCLHFIGRKLDSKRDCTQDCSLETPKLNIT